MPQAFNYDITFRLIQRMNEMCRERGIRFMVLVFPDRSVFKSNASESIRAMLDAPRLKDVRLANLYDEYTRAGLSLTNYDTYVLDGTFHLTREGHRLTADIVCRLLADAGWVR